MKNKWLNIFKRKPDPQNEFFDLSQFSNKDIPYSQRGRSTISSKTVMGMGKIGPITYTWHKDRHKKVDH